MTSFLEPSSLLSRDAVGIIAENKGKERRGRLVSKPARKNDTPSQPGVSAEENLLCVLVYLSRAEALLGAGVLGQANACCRVFHARFDAQMRRLIVLVVGS